MKSTPWRRVAGGDHAVEEVDARGDAVHEVHRAPEPHQVAGRRGGQLLVHGRRRGRRAGFAPRPARGRRGRSRRSRASALPRALSRRSASEAPPCTIPNSAWSGRVPRRAAALGPAQGALGGGTDAQRPRRRHRRPAGCGGWHSSSTMAMSAPSASWIATAPSGVRRRRRPSSGERKVDALLVDARGDPRARSPGSRRCR